MACKMNLWSLTLLPGEKYPMYIRRDFQITNVALGEELRSKDGRSVVKVTHQPLPPLGDDSDSEFDSDIDIDDDEELDEEEFELDTEEGFKLTPKKGKAAVNGDDASDEDEEDDDEEDDEDDEDFDDDDEAEETNVICALTAGKIEQVSIDLTFVSGDAVMFEATGDNAVHLLGNYIYQPGLEDSDDESDYDEEHDDYSELYDDDEELEEGDDVPVGKITEIAETVVAPKKVVKEAIKEAVKPAAAATENKKRKADAIESPAAKAAATEAADDLSKAQKKKLAKKSKRESTGAESATAAPAQEKKAESKKDTKQQKRTLPSGLIIEDVKVGDGPAAKSGKRLSMRYIGKLENGKQFDANTNGKPFSFVLGRGEVIKGWDEGLAGMAVGGERRLTIPAPLAYGNQKLPGIPKGSTLKFDVKLVSVA